MGEQKFELEITVGRENPHYPSKQSDDYITLFVEHTMEMQKAVTQCESISLINGKPVTILKLELSGDLHIDHYFITYEMDGQKYKHGFGKEEFYKL